MEFKLFEKSVDIRKRFDMVISMKIQDIKKLNRGDKVFWNDPDEGACSRIYDIKTVKIFNPNLVEIEDKNGDVLECPPSELAKAKKYRVRMNWRMCADVEVWAGNNQSAASMALKAPLPSSDTWEYVPDSEMVDEELDIRKIKE